jgi:hypothetical protein
MTKSYWKSWFWRAKFWASGMFTGHGPAAIVPTVPGVEYTLPENRCHFTMPENRCHFTIPEDDQ